MNKNELKKILRPLIKECIKEVLFNEEGTLSHIIKEVATGLSEKQQITEAKQFKAPTPKPNTNFKQHKQKLLEAIGKGAYNGVNLFEGTTPTNTPATQGQAQGPLSGIAANDPGVDISSIFGAKAFAMNQKMMENK